MTDESERLPVSKLDDPDMQAVPAAMERAVRRAHWDAHVHGTKVLVVENGEMVEVDPDPELYEDYRAAKLKEAFGARRLLIRQLARPDPLAWVAAQVNGREATPATRLRTRRSTPLGVRPRASFDPGKRGGGEA